MPRDLVCLTTECTVVYTSRGPQLWHELRYHDEISSALDSVRTWKGSDQSHGYTMVIADEKCGRATESATALSLHVKFGIHLAIIYWMEI